MTDPHVVLAHDVVGGPTGMGLVVAAIGDAVLDRGWRLTVVAAEVAPGRVARATFRRVPTRAIRPPLARYAVWAAEAAAAIRRLDADVVHVHSPALLGVADLMTCHHLAQAAYDAGVRPAPGRAARLRAAEAWANCRVDHRRYRRRPGGPHLSFVSGFLRDEFTRLYGVPRGGDILPPPAPAWRPVTEAERAAARRRWGVPTGLRGPNAQHTGTVVGYLGGDDPRKGVAHVARLASDGGVEVLAAGPGSERLRWPHGRGVGYVEPDGLLEACDVVVAPTLFDAAPVAVLQAVARGVPVVVGSRCGWAEPLARHGAGVVWTGGPVEGAGLLDAVRQAAAVPADGCRRFTEEFSVGALEPRLFDAYADVIGSRSPRPAASGCLQQ